MIRWTEVAAEHLDNAYDYIARSNGEHVATRIAELIIAAIERLAAHPMLGRPGRVEGTRELVVAKTPFLVAYTIEKDRIVVLAIYHGARQWPSAF